MCLGVPAEIVAFDETESGRAKVSLSGVERMISTDLPVSYTHLDVYKRQTKA